MDVFIIYYSWFDCLLMVWNSHGRIAKLCLWIFCNLLQCTWSFFRSVSWFNVFAALWMLAATFYSWILTMKQILNDENMITLYSSIKQFYACHSIEINELADGQLNRFSGKQPFWKILKKLVNMCVISVGHLYSIADF